MTTTLLLFNIVLEIQPQEIDQEIVVRRIGTRKQEPKLLHFNHIIVKMENLRKSTNYKN